MPRKRQAAELVFDDESELLIYFNDIENSRGLSAEIEQVLSRDIKNGDEEALKRLVSKNLRFVVSIAKEYVGNGVSLPDLIQAGNMGLIVAAKRFDGTKGFKLISYAVWWIRQGILQTLAEHSRIVRLPTNKVGELIRLGKIDKKMTQVLGRAPTTKEITEAYKEIDNIEDLRMISQKPVSLDERLEDDSLNTFLDYLTDNSQSVEESIEVSEIRTIISDGIKLRLDDREARVIRRYFGLDGAPPQTLEQIATELKDKKGTRKLTRERVRQIKERALPKLRAYIRSRMVDVL